MYCLKIKYRKTGFEACMYFADLFLGQINSDSTVNIVKNLSFSS